MFRTSTDLSSFFKRLCPLPTLRQLDIRVAFNRSLDDDPSGLARLVSGSSSTLRYLRLRFDSIFKIPTDVFHLPSKPLLSEWSLRTIPSDLNVSIGLQTLELFVPRVLSFEILLKLVQQSASTLRKLAVWNCYFQFQEVEAIVQVFRSQRNPPLAILELTISSLKADHFDLLGDSLPELHYLKLNAGDIMGGDEMAFRQAMKNRSFPNSKLYDIKILKPGLQLNNDTMASITRCFPSIQL